MPSQDTTRLKERIKYFIKSRGASLPVHIAKSIETSMLFTSAFLSELVSEKSLKMSHLRIGSSPLYFMRGQEHSLEKFSGHLRSKEKEAFSLLKEKSILKDSKLDAPIKVAIREIKDFAIPFHKDNELYWRYLTVSEEEVRKLLENSKEPTSQMLADAVVLHKEMPLIDDVKKQFEEKKIEPEEKGFSVLEKEKPKKNLKETGQKKVAKKATVIGGKQAKKNKVSPKKNDKFFNKVKEFLTKKSIEILDIENFSKDDLILRIKIKGEEKILVAYNKKKITEKEIIQAYKKASEVGLGYFLLSFGEPSKKLKDFINAVEKLEDVWRVE